MRVFLVATTISCLLTGLAVMKCGDLRGVSFRRLLGWILLAALPLMLVASFRNGVGTDYKLTYAPTYCALEYMRGEGPAAEKVKAFARLARRAKFGGTPRLVRGHFIKVLERMEPGYYGLMKAFSKFGFGFQGVVAVCAVLTTLCVFLAIFRQSRWPVLAVFLYVFAGDYFLSLNVMRQYVAVGLALVAVPFIRDRRPLCFLACVGVGFLFHYSALLLLPCYALSRWEIRPKAGFALAAAGLLVSVVIAPAAEFALLHTGLRAYARYFHNAEANEGFEFLLLAINLCFLVLGAWYWRRAKEGNSLYPIWYGMLAVGTAALAMSGMLPLMKRINYYFAAANFLMLPEMILAEENPKRRRLLTVLVIMAFVAETIVSVCILNKNGVLPYRIK